MTIVPQPYATKDKVYNYNEDFNYEKRVTPYVTKILEHIFDVVEYNNDRTKQLSGYGDYTCDGKRLELKTHRYNVYLMSKDFEERNGYRTMSLELWRDVDRNFRGSNITTFTGSYWLEAFVNKDETDIVEFFLFDAQLLRSFILNEENINGYFRHNSKNKYINGTPYNSQSIQIPIKHISLFIYAHEDFAK